METGEKIRTYRKKRHMTQRELAEKVGLSEPTIRNFELGIRNASEEHLAKIAKVLEISPQALKDIEVTSSRDALELLFRMEDTFGLLPTDEGMLAIDPNAANSQKLAMAIKKWRRKLNEVQDGTITPEEYQDWRASFLG